MVKFVNDVLVTGSVPTSKILYSAADEIAASDGEGEATEIATSIFATSSDLSSGLAAKADISSLASVATSGNYDDLGNLPALGTAASEDISFFADAAQGALADSALQNAAAFATAAQGATADTALQPSGNLSGLSNYGTARSNLGLGTAATAAATDFATSDDAISRRATATGINLNSLLGVTAGYTVPTIGSKKFHVTGLCFRNASTSLSLAAISAGWNGTYTNILPITVLASLTSASLDKIIPMSGTIPAGSATDVLNFQCTTAQGVAATVDADIIGYFA